MTRHLKRFNFESGNRLSRHGDSQFSDAKKAALSDGLPAPARTLGLGDLASAQAVNAHRDHVHDNHRQVEGDDGQLHAPQLLARSQPL